MEIPKTDNKNKAIPKWLKIIKKIPPYVKGGYFITTLLYYIKTSFDEVC